MLRFRNINWQSDLEKFIKTKEQKNLQSDLHQIKGVATKAKAGDIDAAIENASKIPPIWEEIKKELSARFVH